MFNRRSILAAGAALPTLVSGLLVSGPSFAQSRAAVDAADLNRLRRRLASFFERVVALSTASPPPGVNASNGYFVNGMKNDGELAIAQRPIQTDSAGGAVCANLTQSVMRACREGFAPGLHSATGVRNLRLAVQVFNAALPSILEISPRIAAAIYTSGATSAAILTDVNRQISSLGNAVASRGIVSSGTHANGWISVGIRDQANGVIGQINQEKDSVAADGRDYLEILNVLLGQMAALPTQDHDPWLRAEWQLGFTAICATGAKVMRNPPE